MKSTWNPDVPPGTKLAVQSRGFWTVLTVDRTTATQVVCKEGHRLTRATGKLQGQGDGRWEAPQYAQPISPEIEAEMEAQALRIWTERSAARYIAALSPAGIKQVRELVRSIWNVENMPHKDAPQQSAPGLVVQALHAERERLQKRINDIDTLIANYAMAVRR